MTTSTLFFNEDVSAWDISAALGMFRNAATFEHNRCAWARLADPTVNNTDVFLVQAVLPAAEQVRAEYLLRTDVPPAARAGQVKMVDTIIHLPLKEMQRQLDKSS